MKSVFFICFFCSIIFANTNNKILIDRYFSPYSSSEDLFTLHRTFECFEDIIIKEKYKTKNTLPSGFFRLLELGLFWDPFNMFLSIAQHEVFGHGYRIRSLTDKYAYVIEYSINISWPIATFDSSGYTGYVFNQNLSSMPFSSISSAGVESSAIMSNRLAIRWLENKRRIDPLASSLYIFSQHDLTIYTMMTDRKQQYNNSNDIASYIKLINYTYPNQKPLTHRSLKNKALINFIDPMTFYSIYSWFKYIFVGKKFKIPMIKISNIRFLPSVRLGLTPFGPEYYLDMYILKKRAIYSYIRYLDHANNKAFGIGVEALSLIHLKNTYFGFRADLFRQPKIYFSRGYFPYSNEYVNYDEKKFHNKKYGASGSFVITHNVKNSNSQVYAQLGYKTKGYVAGENLKSKPIARIGFISKW